MKKLDRNTSSGKSMIEQRIKGCNMPQFLCESPNGDGGSRKPRLSRSPLRHSNLANSSHRTIFSRTVMTAPSRARFLRIRGEHSCLLTLLNPVKHCRALPNEFANCRATARRLGKPFGYPQGSQLWDTTYLGIAQVWMPQASIVDLDLSVSTQVAYEIIRVSPGAVWCASKSLWA